MTAAGAIHTGGTAFSSESDKTYNFGQQPFAAPYNYSSKFSPLNTTNTGFSRGPIAQGFDGRLDTYCNADNQANAYLEFDFSGLNLTGDVKMKVAPGANDFTVSLNNGAPVLASEKDANYFINFPNTGAVNKITLSANNQSQQAIGFSQLYVGGELLLDSDAPMVEAFDNNLFQTWAEWNGVTELRFDNPDSVAKYDAIVDSFSNYHSERLTFRNNLRLNLRAAGYDGDQLYHVLCD